MSAPERIWADPPSLFDGVDLWHEKQEGAELTAVEYIRKDASDAAIAAARAEGVREGMLKAATICNERGAREEENFGLVRGTQNYYRARDAIRAAASIGIPLAAIGIVALGNHLAFRPRVEDPPPASWLAKMKGDRE